MHRLLPARLFSQAIPAVHQWRYQASTRYRPWMQPPRSPLATLICSSENQDRAGPRQTSSPQCQLVARSGNRILSTSTDPKSLALQASSTLTGKKWPGISRDNLHEVNGQVASAIGATRPQTPITMACFRETAQSSHHHGDRTAGDDDGHTMIQCRNGGTFRAQDA